MHPIFYYIIFFLAIGAIGFAIANRKATPAERKHRWLKYFMYILITGIVILSIFYNLFFWIACIIVFFATVELIRVSAGKKKGYSSYILAGSLLFLLGAAGFLLFAWSGKKDLFLYIFMQVMVFDGFSQIIGQIAGKHQLAPSISPAKTWEGLIGGWLFCIATALSTAGWIPVQFTEALGFGFMTGLSCFTGDMLASWYKRKVKVKDYSNWLPGQGGFLD